MSAMRYPYPGGWMLGVADDRAVAAAGSAAAERRGAREVRPLVRDGADLFSLGRSGPLEGLLNVLRHLNTDQAADLLVYDAARADGRTVLAVRGLGDAARRGLAADWRAAGLHFVNYYGAVVTEDWDGWRGEPLAGVPDWAWR